MNAENIEYGERELLETLQRGGNAIHPIRTIVPDLLDEILFYKWLTYVNWSVVLFGII